MNRWMTAAAFAVALGGAAAPANAQGKLFKNEIGEVNVGEVKTGGPTKVPFITWGGDFATFHANGGLKTKDGSIYKNMGLDLELVNGDDFVEQCRMYLRGETPFLRGTLRMVALAAEKLSEKPETTPVCFLQLTWSGGDHMVSREELHTANDLKGHKIALQKGGPHVGLLGDILDTAGLSWSDVEIVWCDNITGPGSAAEKFKKDPSVDACLVITPDMFGLCGGLNEIGSGAQGTVVGAHVLVSTQELSRSIADVYCVRKDFMEKNPDLVKKFAAGFLKGTEELLGVKKAWEANPAKKDYITVLKLGQEILGKEAIPTIENDAHGLVSDARFVGLPGNEEFFNGSGSVTNFGPKSVKAIDSFCDNGFAEDHGTIKNGHLDFNAIKSAGGLAAKVKEKQVPRFLEMSDEDLFPEDILAAEKEGKKEVFSFEIFFEPNQNEFPHAKYSEQFQKALELAQLYADAVVAIGGHGDPRLMYIEMIKAGFKNGKMTRTGHRGAWKYQFKGKPLDLKDTDTIMSLIKANEFTGGQRNPKDIADGLAVLSKQRAEAVKQALVEYARGHGLDYDESQFQPVGVGARQPAVPAPRTAEDSRANRRVEFRIVRVPAEAVKETDFDY